MLEQGYSTSLVYNRLFVWTNTTFFLSLSLSLSLSLLAKYYNDWSFWFTLLIGQFIITIVGPRLLSLHFFVLFLNYDTLPRCSFLSRPWLLSCDEILYAVERALLWQIYGESKARRVFWVNWENENYK